MCCLHRNTGFGLVLAIAALAPGAQLPQVELPPDLLLLTRVKRHLKRELGQLPNYTCVQTMERWRQPRLDLPLQRLDTVRLEVAEVGNRELYSWPGARNFEETNINAFVPGGLAGSGAFASHARSIFVNDLASTQYAGEMEIDRRKAAGWNYFITGLTSGYKISHAGGETVVGVKGSFWVDAKSLDLMRLVVEADGALPHPLAEVHTEIAYARVRMGQASMLLPESALLITRDLNGRTDRNQIEFSHCRQYGSQSTVRFGEPGETAAGPGESQEIQLPAGLVIPLQLDSAITETAAVGDLIRAHVASEVKLKGKTVVPSGALVTGRIRRMVHETLPQPYSTLGLEFDEIAFANARGRFFASLEDVDAAAGLHEVLKRTSRSEREIYGLGRLGLSTTEDIRAAPIPGVTTLMIEGSRFELRPGLRMTWKTEPAGR